MRFRLGFAACCVFVLSFIAYAPAAGQTNMLMQARTGAGQDRLVLDSAGGFVVTGDILKASTLIPPSGAGTRMVFWPGKQAFRAGYVTDGRWDNANSGQYSVAFGYNSTASGSGSFAAAYGDSATNTGSVALGYYSDATGYASSAMGHFATASGSSSMALGHEVIANATNGVAIGYRVSTAAHSGAVVIGDGSADTLEATANNQFAVRAAGGYRLYTNAAATLGAYMSAGGTTWDAISDRNRKQDFLAIDGEDLLGRLRHVPVTTWRYREEADGAVRHIGPMAQDWQAAFGFRSDTTTINSGDLDGVNLAGVKALEERTRLQAARIQELEKALARVTTLETEVAELKALLIMRGSGTPPRSAVD